MIRPVTTSAIARSAQFLILGCLALPAHGHMGNWVYPVYEFPPAWLPDLHDGSVSDWEDALPGPSITYYDMVPVGLDGHQATDQADLSFRCFLGWSYREQRLYIAVERVDDVYLNTYPLPGNLVGAYINMRGNDCVEFMVDGDHSGGQYYFGYMYDYAFPGGDLPLDELKLLGGFQAQAYVALAESPPGLPQILTSNAGSPWVTAAPYLDVGGVQVGEAPNYSLVEVGLTLWDELDWRDPGASTPSRLEPGKIIGFQLSLLDYDASPRIISAESHHTLNGSPFGLFTADDLADAQLIPCQESGCSQSDGSVVRADSWGRIKASMR